MKVVTLRNLPPELARAIRRKADEDHASINRTVISLLQESIGIGTRRKTRRVYHDLDALSGSWQQDEVATFTRALVAQRTIGADLWK